MKPIPKDPKTIRKLEGWLRKPGNSKAKIASLLGYQTSETVSKWISRGRVASRERDNVLQIITGERNEDIEWS